MAVLLGDGANMHALDPAKVHLDRIVLHYAALQWCSILWRERDSDTERERGREREREMPTKRFT